MFQKRPAPEPPTREEIFRKKGKSYVPCYSSTCPMKDHCLHAVLSPYATDTSPTVRAINLSFEGAETEKCIMYRSSEPISMAVGLSTIYDDMPSRLERYVKHDLITVTAASATTNTTTAYVRFPRPKKPTSATSSNPSAGLRDPSSTAALRNTSGK